MSLTVPLIILSTYTIYISVLNACLNNPTFPAKLNAPTTPTKDAILAVELLLRKSLHPVYIL